MQAKNRILITGCAGFIGFHLAKHLLSQNIEVIGCDNFNRYYDPKLKQQRADLLRQQGMKLISLDLCARDYLFELIEREKPTHIVHLAAQAGVRYSIDKPHSYIDSNIAAFLNILEACRNNPDIPLIYASSSSVYGNSNDTPFSEESPTDKPVSLYGATKKANEVLAYSYHDLYGIKATGLRFFTVYGPWGRPDMAYYKFAEAITNNHPIDIYNHGDMQRDFTYIDDIVDALCQSITLSAPYEIFNLGNNKAEKLSDMITILENLLGKEAEKNYLPMQKGDVKITYANISKAEKLLNYQPKTTLEQGLEKFVNWYQASLIC